jgi:flavorubredoxin
MFPLVREAVVSVLPVARLRYIAFSHAETDECGSVNEWLGAAPQSVPLRVLADALSA